MIGENISAHFYIIYFTGNLAYNLLLCSNEDVDEGFVINQEGIGLRLTAMEYWKCSKAGITLPSLNKKEPDCKFVIAESLPEQGTRICSHLLCVKSATFDSITAATLCCLQVEIRLTPSWRSTEPLEFSTSGCTRKI